jgi:hypothetical protein
MITAWISPARENRIVRRRFASGEVKKASYFAAPDFAFLAIATG